MNQENNKQSYKYFWVVIIIVTTALLSSNLVYWWQNYISEFIKNDLKNQIQTLKKQIEIPKLPDITIKETTDKFSHACMLIGEKFVIENYGKKIGEIEANELVQPKIFKQTRNTVYLGLYIGEIGPCSWWQLITLYKINLKNNQLSKFIDLSDGSNSVGVGIKWIADLSPDETMVSIINNEYDKDINNYITSIILKNINNGSEKQIKIPDKYSFDSGAIFSPDGNKIVYSASTIDSNNQQGAIFVVNLDNGQQTTIATDKHFYFTIEGWQDNGKVDYNYSPF